MTDQFEIRMAMPPYSLVVVAPPKPCCDVPEQVRRDSFDEFMGLPEECFGP